VGRGTIRMRGIAVVGLLALLAGCATGPTGPVVGDWRGSQPSIVQWYRTVTELILDGSPGAMSGTYHLVINTPGLATLSGASSFRRWSDRWEVRMLKDANGQPYEVVHLFNVPGTQRPDYALTKDNLLIPIYNEAHPDFSEAGRRIALYPLPRTAYGYGRP
jgi:hypothetical protein